MEGLNNLKNMLVIGGATRNVGKTTFTCNIIKRFSVENDIVALKIKTIYKNQLNFHGKLENENSLPFELIEKFDIHSKDDTGMFLAAGAKRAFMLRAGIESLQSAFEQFYSKISPDQLIICESNSIRKIVIPGIYLLIKHQHINEMKASASELEHVADCIIYSDGSNHHFSLSDIVIKENIWHLKQLSN